MSNSIWNDVDAYILDGLRDGLMVGGVYADLPVAQIEVGESFDPDHVALPFALVRGVQNDPEEAGPHGIPGRLLLANLSYPYEVVIVCKSSVYANAFANIKELARRVREFVRLNPAFGQLTSDDGEMVTDVWPGRTLVEVHGKIGVNQGEYMAIAQVEFRVVTELAQ